MTNKFWIHKKTGNVYEIIMHTNEASSKSTLFPLTVVYKDINGNIWSRPASEFYQKFDKMFDTK